MGLNTKGETLLESYISILIFGIIVLAVSSIIMGANKINVYSYQKINSFDDTLNVVNTGTSDDIDDISIKLDAARITVSISTKVAANPIVTVTQTYTPDMNITDNGLITIR